MNLNQVANKYRISENALNSKEEGLVVAAKSVNEIVNELEQTKDIGSALTKLNRLKEFMLDVKNTSF